MFVWLNIQHVLGRDNNYKGYKCSLRDSEFFSFPQTEKWFGLKRPHELCIVSLQRNFPSGIGSYVSSHFTRHWKKGTISSAIVNLRLSKFAENSKHQLASHPFAPHPIVVGLARAVGWEKMGQLFFMYTDLTETLETCVIDIWLLVSLALHCMASYVALAHNHPTGILQASANDKAATFKIHFTVSVEFV